MQAGKCRLFFMNYTDITFRQLSKEQIEILIALLPDMGFHGMEESETGLNAYADEGKADVAALEKLAGELNITFSQEMIAAKNWNASWEANFEPVLIPGKIQIRAHFHSPDESVKHQILITPKMSFGTGHHPTTRMMMNAMLLEEFNGKSVADFGAGTGILSILAHQLGANSIVAIDNDNWSIENIKENTSLNNADHIEVLQAEDLDTIGQVDIMLANINKHVLIEHVERIRSKTSAKGLLIISGLLRTDYDDIVSVYVPFFGPNFMRFEEGEWIALTFRP